MKKKNFQENTSVKLHDLAFLENFRLASLHSSEAATGGVLLKKVFFENFENFIGKHLCQSLFLIKCRPEDL